MRIPQNKFTNIGGICIIRYLIIPYRKIMEFDSFSKEISLIYIFYNIVQHKNYDSTIKSNNLYSFYGCSLVSAYSSNIYLAYFVA